MSPLSRVTFVIVAARALASCLGEHQIVTTYDILQAAMVPAPTPMGADAPLAPVRGFTVEGGATVAQSLPGGTRRDGAGGQMVPVTTLRGRVAFRPIRHLEVALAGEGSPGAWAAPHARDVPSDRLDSAGFFRLGPQVRVVFNPRSAVRVGLSSAGLFGSLPWHRNIDTTTTTSTYDPQSGGYVNGTRVTSSTTQSGTAGFFWVNTALFVTGDLGGRGSLLGGVSVQNQPVAFGSLIVSETCFTPDRRAWPDCTGSSSGSVPALQGTFASTAFLSGELRLGASLSLVGRLHALLAGDPQVIASGRFGGGLDLRATFGP